VENGSLTDFRTKAAEASGGVSGSEIKVAILNELRGRDLSGLRLLDYGAGTGMLLSLLSDEHPRLDLTGVDFFARPEGIKSKVHWKRIDLNEDVGELELFDIVTCSEVIEHLENPRHTFRQLAKLLKPSGALILTMPNQESIRSLLALLTRGHFVAFQEASYPAHITALVRLDLTRLCRETGFAEPQFSYTNVGGIPKFPHKKWQYYSFGLLKGRLFSDNLIMRSTLL
jgi:2-polyprenyl-3-methyl-5-hydroxy-6-metoxy-1,4-benzoquinol methylase